MWQNVTFLHFLKDKGIDHVISMQIYSDNNERRFYSSKQLFGLGPDKLINLISGILHLLIYLLTEGIFFLQTMYFYVLQNDYSCSTIIFYHIMIKHLNQSCTIFNLFA